MKVLSALLVATAAGFLAQSSVQAGEWDKLTKISIAEPVRLPTITLQPGNYRLKLMESAGNRHIVAVEDENGKGLAIILAIPNYRLQPTGKTEFQFWETPAGETKAIRAWFYPGDNFGQEFAYPKEEAARIAAYTHTEVPSIADSKSDLKTAQVDDFDKADSTPPAPVAAAEAPVESARVETPEPAPQPAAAAPAEPTPTPVASAAAELPHTGSEIPLIGLLGVLSLVAFLATMGRKRSRV
jgi:LPXTG-motif cell wall-anchored protein